MKYIENLKQVKQELGVEFPKPVDMPQIRKEVVIKEKKKPGSTQERHQVSTEDGIVGGSYLSREQTLELYNQINEGKDSRETTDNYNKKMGIAD